ncbi:hypothetical protein GCM10009107_32420 [Ideonella azotifigens]|uniref:Uncharacterized protein n=1 Tax=Ideonella azotifigens TaxID=513160 RepID=A0ABN1K5G4_9BURK
MPAVDAGQVKTRKGKGQRRQQGLALRVHEPEPENMDLRTQRTQRTQRGDRHGGGEGLGGKKKRPAPFGAGRFAPGNRINGRRLRWTARCRRRHPSNP